MRQILMDQQQARSPGLPHLIAEIGRPQPIGVRLVLKVAEHIALNGEHAGQQIAHVLGAGPEPHFALSVLEFGAQPRQLEHFAGGEVDFLFLRPPSLAVHPHYRRGALLPLALGLIGLGFVLEHRRQRGLGGIDHLIALALLRLGEVVHPIAGVDERTLGHSPDHSQFGEAQQVAIAHALERALDALHPV